MDAFKWFNSRDVRDYLRKINYQFNTLETAWLVYCNQSACLSEQLSAFREIIDTMPDAILEKPIQQVGINTLHELLKEYIKIKENTLQKFSSTEDNPVFQAEWYYNDSNIAPTRIDKVFLSEEECLKYIAEEKWEREYDQFAIFRLNQDGYIVKGYNEKCFVSSIYDSRYSHDETAVLSYLSDIQPNFPLPFKQGDILILNYPSDRNLFLIGGAFVLKKISKDYDKNNEVESEYGDIGTVAWGFFQHPDGSVYYENITNYMDLEYYRGELNGKMRILTIISDFLGGKMELSRFANTYHQILAEEYAKKIYIR